MPPLRLASIDVGSNTIRLLLARPLPDQNFQPLRVERIITRLGGGFSRRKGLDPISMERTLKGLCRFARIIEREGVEKVFAVGTGVLREAKNRRAFVQKVKEKTGLSLRILSGREEGRAMVRGALGALKDPNTPRLMADVGGWSTEVIWGMGGRIRKSVSLELGAVRLAERFLRKDPPTRAEMEALDRLVRVALRRVRRKWEKEGWEARHFHPQLAATAGTAATLGAIDLALPAYDPQKIRGHLISRSRLKKWYRRLSLLPMQSRSRLPGLEKGREDLILPGTAVLLGILEVFERSALEVIDSGLLEGILLEGISQTGVP